MARVRLNAGGLTAAQVRMGSRGASERIRPPGDDINTGDGRDRTRTRACTLCGSEKVVGVARPRRCAACLADEAIVHSVSTKLAAAKQPPLGARGIGQDYSKLRRVGEQARDRLAERRKGRPRPKKASSTPPLRAAKETRRVTNSQKRDGAALLQARLVKMVADLAALQPTDKRRDQLRQDVQVARRLLSEWSEVVH